MKKQAAGLKQPPGVPVSDNATPKPTSGSPVGPELPGTSSPKQVAQKFYGGKNIEIVKMQDSIKNFSQNIKQYLTPTTQQNETGARQYTGKDSFTNFIAQHYANQSDKVGQEYTANIGKTKMEDKKPSQLNRGQQVLQGLDRIGTPNLEFKSDGNWGPRTNNALKNVYALAYGMMHLAKDLDELNSIEDYGMGDLTDFNELIPNTAPVENGKITMPLAEQNQRAKLITLHIDTLLKVFKDFRAIVLENPTHKKYIETTKAFETYQKSQALTSKDNELISKSQELAKSYPIKLENHNVLITLNDLANLKNFTAWKDKNKIAGDNAELLAEVKSAINSGKTFYSPALTNRE